jgi:hypothetical protein
MSTTPEPSTVSYMHQLKKVVQDLIDAYSSSSKGPDRFALFVEKFTDSLPLLLSSHAASIDDAYTKMIDALRSSLDDAVRKAAEENRQAALKDADVCVVSMSLQLLYCQLGLVWGN